MKDRIKVIHIVDKFGVKGSSVHGVSRLFSWWMPRFDRERYDVRLVGLRPSEKASEELNRQGIELTTLGRGKFDLRTVTDIMKIIRCEKPDILHLHGYGAANFGRMAAAASGVPVIVHEHFVDPAMPIVQVPFDAALSRFCTYGIAVSESVRRFMIERRRLPSERVEVIYNGAPLEQFRPLPKEVVEAERRRWNIPEDHQVVGTIGRLDRQKGNRYLLEAAADLVAAHPQPVTFLIVGDGPLMDELKAQARRLNLDDRVIFTGYLSDVPRIQAILDVQAFPSIFEGTPLTLFEAMSTERTIVSTDVDGLGEVLRDGEDALIVPARDPHRLAQALQRVLSNPPLAGALAQSAGKRSREFSIERTVERLQEVYEKLKSVSARETGAAHLERSKKPG